MLLLRDLHLAAQASRLALARRLGLRERELACLTLVSYGGPGPVALRDVSQHLGVSPAAATELVDRLERDGLVGRTRSTTDGRVVHLHLTPAARARIDQGLAPLLADLRDLDERLTASERAVVERYLTAARDTHLAHAAPPARATPGEHR